MIGLGLMKGLCVCYLALCGVFIWEGDYARALYWFGAAIITTSVLVIK